MRKSLLLLLAVCFAGVAHAEVRMDPVEYKQGDTVLRGTIAWDPAVTARRPGILVVHEWWGANDYARMRARKLAELGYVAFALDMYGEGKTTTHPQEAGEWAMAVGGQQDVARARFMAAYDVLKANEHVDPTKIAAIGYCFGGSVVLTMALSGADLAAAVSFHGGLGVAAGGEKVKAKILVCHGAADAMSTQEQVDTFQKTLTDAGADWEMNIYGGAKHSFTNPGADKAGMAALGYNAEADHRSWRAMQGFLKEAFGEM